MSVTTAKGFRASGVRAGIKESGAPDVALVANDGPLCVAAGVFTANRFKAAPVLWSQQAVADGELRAVVLNSGGANACTGSPGFVDTHQTAERVAQLLEISAGDVAVCSTGLIGERLPMAKILTGVDKAVAELDIDGGGDAATAIMTTDSVPKLAEIHLGGYAIGGMAKGAGMIAPALATMLVVVTTDAVITAEQADSALRSATGVTFDRIDSDGCMSTNDTVLLLSSGASGVTPNIEEFTAALTGVCWDLAGQIIADAEGASKNIAIVVDEALTADDAVEVARAIARSNLLKCAIHGADPNWGRVLSAIGTTNAVFNPDLVDVAINGIWICKGGAIGVDRDLVNLSGRAVEIRVALRAGAESATVLTNDLTAEYVH
ncbi:MAG: bifunctional glutamate N-acetyltransferase/amino-acid acetyltransferase ArgJ, partial [Candidatus Nanopelagicales bacterium]|nr:bifunctional glutamate N-acetyltransferase/amino-acid acetyltransferase ArgJ [Candidatus Nanopelagicales bacterium]